jgi:DNA helicase-2/ATP-dependent DNA helicase PcrA
MTHDYLADLNEQQRHAVKHGVKDGSALDAGPLLVIAGAGTGKTKTLAHRVAHLVVNGIDPQRILLLTFTRRAALDMTGRVKRITSAAIGAGQIDLPWAGTFHAVGARILRQYAQRIGLKPSFTILDRSDAADLMDVIRHDLGLSKKQTRFPGKDTCLAIYSFAINSGASIKATLESKFPWCIEWQADLRKLFREYVAAKHRQNVLDYDDLLLCWAEMINDPDLAAELGDRFDHVLVDEYQDTNCLQSRILLKLKPDGRGVTVVGDDAQSIYSFRAATVRNILDFPGQFDPPARIITLEHNYRSTQPILDACNDVIGFAKERFTKNLRSDRKSKQQPFLTTVMDETAQARYVTQQILAAREAGVPLKSQAGSIAVGIGMKDRLQDRSASVLWPSRLEPLAASPFTPSARQSTGSHVPRKAGRASRRLNAGCRSGSLRHPPLSTLLQRFACARLSRPCLPESCPGVSATLTTTAFDRSSLRWLGIGS